MTIAEMMFAWFLVAPTASSQCDKLNIVSNPIQRLHLVSDGILPYAFKRWDALQQCCRWHLLALSNFPSLYHLPCTAWRLTRPRSGRPEKAHGYGGAVYNSL